VKPIFRIIYHSAVVKRDIPRLDAGIRSRVRHAIEAKLSVAPEELSKPLAYSRKGLWRLRVGDWPVVCVIRGNEVWVLRIGHRREVYDSIPEPPE